MKILFVLPTYNEEKIIRQNAWRLFDFLNKNLFSYAWQILIADNGSQDQTVQIAQALRQENDKFLYFHIPQKGRGYALKKAWQEYEADIYFYMDADLATGLEAINQTLNILMSQEADIVVGSRLSEKAAVERSFRREVISRLYNLFLKTILHLEIKDTQCGFKALKGEVVKKVIPKIKNNQFFFDTELLFITQKKGFKIKEIPVEWIETRDKVRKSKVNILATTCNYLKEIMRLRLRRN